MVTHKNDYKTMELHHGMTILCCHKVLIMSHGLHYGIVLIKLMLQLDVFIYSNVTDDIHSKICILSYLFELEIKFKKLGYKNKTTFIWHAVWQYHFV